MPEDPVQVAPHVYSVRFENDRVRLLEVRMKPGDSSAMHSHPDYVIYSVSDASVKFTDGSGESADVTLGGGDVMWRDAEQHSVENTGSAEVHALLFELK